MKNSGRTVVWTALAGVACLGLAARAQAQVTTGTILGTVKDAQGQLVAGATVTVTEAGKQTSSVYVTDATGSYVAPFLIPGTYEVAVELQGFRKHVRRGVVLQVNQRARVDVTLELGTFAEATEVTALAPLTRSDSAEMGEVIEERAVRELPLNGRNFATLVYLAPGVTAGQIGENLSGASTFNPRGASNFNALGSQANANAWLIDGIDNNEYTFNTVIVMPSVESVREFKVLTGTFSAEFGRGAGVVSVSTKSGSNELHGTAFEYLRNDVFDARSYFARQDAPKPPLDRHQYGAWLSGPLIKNQTFFFVDYAGLTETRGLTFVNTVPTAKTRAGDFSDYRTPAGQLITIYDPLTTRPNPSGTGFIRDPFPGNVIPADRLNQVGLNVASIYPLPNGSGNFDNYTSTANRDVTDHAVTVRLDHKAGARDSFFVRYSYDNYKLDAPQGQAACCLATPPEAAQRFDLGPFVAGIQNTRLTTHGAAFNWSHIFGPTVVNEVRLGFAKTNPETRQSDFGHKAAESLGIQGINLTEFTSGLPNLNIQDVTGISGGPAFLPVNPKQIHYQIEDSLAWVRGRHSLKTGYRFILRHPSPFTNTDTRGSISINRNLTNNPQTNSQGSGLATLLLGYTTGGARGFLLEPYDMTNSEHALFVQDDWKVSSRLTANVGVRYEVYVPDTEEKDRLVNFDPAGLRLVYAGEDGVDRRVNKRVRHNVAPRLGLAWDVAGNGKSVLRANAGLYYARQNMLSQVGSTTANGLQQQTIVRGLFTGLVPGVLPMPVWPAVLPVQPVPAGQFPLFTGVRVFARDYHNPKITTANVAFEQEIAPDWSMYADFTWSKGVYLTRFLNVNRADRGSPFSPQLGDVFVATSRGKGLYRGGTVGLRKRFSSGFQLEANYVLSKDMDDDSNERDPFTDRSFDPFDLSKDYALSDRDIRHRFNVYAYGELPGGLRGNARIQARSAQPITPNPRVLDGVDRGRNSIRKDNAFFSLDWRLWRPIRLGGGTELIPTVEMFNTFNNENNVNPLNTPGLFNFDGFLRQGVGDPRQVQLAVKLTF
jgi:hypothetical protein